MQSEYYGPPQPPQGMSPLKVLLIVGAVGASLVFCLIVALVIYGSSGPDTSVYAGNQVPQKFLAIAKEVGALEDGERLAYFYSDAFVDIKQGFYFVSDKKVAVYSEANGDEPLRKIPFAEIESAEMIGSDSVIEDSEITLHLKDGQVVAFPVSSEEGKDQVFLDEIKRRMTDKKDGKDLKLQAL